MFNCSVAAELAASRLTLTRRHNMLIILEIIVAGTIRYVMYMLLQYLGYPGLHKSTH